MTHIWRVDTNAHDTGAMSSNFYHFAQKLFKCWRYAPTFTVQTGD